MPIMLSARFSHDLRSVARCAVPKKTCGLLEYGQVLMDLEIDESRVSILESQRPENDPHWSVFDLGGALST
jgi:hypothetical protein